MSKLAKKDIKFTLNGWIHISYRDEEDVLRKTTFDDINMAWGHVKLLREMGIKDIYVNL